MYEFLENITIIIKALGVIADLIERFIKMYQKHSK